MGVGMVFGVVQDWCRPCFSLSHPNQKQSIGTMNKFFRIEKKDARALRIMAVIIPLYLLACQLLIANDPTGWIFVGGECVLGLYGWHLFSQIIRKR